MAKSGQNPQFTESEIREIVTTANDYEFHVAAHAHGAEGMKRAIRAGVRSIEHATLADEEAIQLFKKHGTWYVPTLAAGWFTAEKAKIPGYFPEMVRAKVISIAPKAQATFRRFYQAGVQIAFGTDSGVIPHGENAKEFRYMVEGGMSPLEALRSATLGAAELPKSSFDSPLYGLVSLRRSHRAGVRSIEHATLADEEAIQLFKKHGTWYVPTLGVEDELGAIEAGKLADVVATPEDPTKDIETMTRVSFVMKGGEIYKRP